MELDSEGKRYCVPGDARSRGCGAKSFADDVGLPRLATRKS